MPESVQNHTNFPPECFGDSWCDNGNVKSQLDSPFIDWTLIFRESSVDQFLLSNHRESNSKQSGSRVSTPGSFPTQFLDERSIFKGVRFASRSDSHAQLDFLTNNQILMDCSFVILEFTNYFVLTKKF